MAFGRASLEFDRVIRVSGFRIVFTSTFSKVRFAHFALFLCWQFHGIHQTIAQEDYAEFLADALPLHLLHVINVKMDS